MQRALEARRAEGSQTRGSGSGPRNGSAALPIAISRTIALPREQCACQNSHIVRMLAVMLTLACAHGAVSDEATTDPSAQWLISAAPTYGTSLIALRVWSDGRIEYFERPRPHDGMLIAWPRFEYHDSDAVVGVLAAVMAARANEWPQYQPALMCAPPYPVLLVNAPDNHYVATFPMGSWYGAGPGPAIREQYCIVLDAFERLRRDDLVPTWHDLPTYSNEAP